MTTPDLLSVLDRLERAESALLSWGYVDGGFTDDEVRSHISDELGLDAAEVDDVLDELLKGALLIRVRAGRRVIYRTRSAEAVRLMARLRQLFPPHLRTGRWRTAPTLVSDYRYDLRPRNYPDRRIDVAAAIESIAAGRDPTLRAAITALLVGRATSFRLARFQVDAAQRILDDLAGRISRGTIIGAGTGSGKTLAFYLPALARVASQIDSGYWTKVLAIYPRNELLKDQFSETFSEARRLDDLLLSRGARRLMVGAFFGPTPHTAGVLAQRASEGRDLWERDARGFVCPFLRCPRCSSDLIWVDNDVEDERERLECRRSSCGGSVEEDEVVLTRRRMQGAPPDVLFTTTEMLNRQMSDGSSGHVFGVGPRVQQRPEVMLLDEVHTYEGTTGAQAAYVIRRWRRAVGRPIQFVGLSATLREAQTFFADFVGLADHAVVSIAPSSGDLISEGMEYLLALRGDPVSGASLLSTTIQTSMLLRRVLEPEHSVETPYGSRLFVFTDDLDVTNRLYFDLLDAEGRDSWGRPNAQGNGPLAALRSSTEPDHPERVQLGQSWDLCEAIGHHLDHGASLRVGRTSSQDPGVAASSDIIVATASLDVGFNDPTVGAVLQHKAPRDAAQFLQRKGRAGRIRGTRPWTVVVLSDYGRDRLAYQGYDLLFDPTLEPRSLPIQNTYVLRIQAAFAFMDWLASRLPQHLWGSVWMDLAGPPEHHQPRSSRARERQERELQAVEEVLRDEGARAEMLQYIQEALRLSPEQVGLIAWEAPRSLLMHLLPTVRRRLASGWSRGGIKGADYQVTRQPIPDFVPANLFSDLNLPETKVELPAARRDAEPTDEQAPVLQALRTFAPGRVSRRYGVEHRYVRHWVPLPIDGGPVVLEVGTFVDGQDAGTREFRPHWGSGTVVYQCIRPWSIRTERPPKRLLDSSNATLEWRSRFDVSDAGDEADVPSPSAWSALIDDLRVFLHARQAAVDIGRFAIASHASLAFEDGERREITASFEQDGIPAALGFVLDVDAVSVRVSVPRFFGEGGSTLDDITLRSFRGAYFAHLVESDGALAQRTNVFQRQWLAQLYLSVIVERALLEQSTLQAAHTVLVQESLSSALQQVLDVIFQALPALEREENEESDEAAVRQRLHQTLSNLADDRQIAQRLGELASVLWDRPDDRWQAWASDRFTATLGAALLEGADRLCRDVGARNLVVDTEVDTDRAEAQVWLSEPTIGGGGIIEEFARRYTSDPRRFFRLVEAALAPSDFELVDSELSRVLDLAASDAEIMKALVSLRTATTQASTAAAMRDLTILLTAAGVSMSHPVSAAMNVRVLRPGSSAQSDALLRDLIREWRAEEERLGIEIDARVFAYVASAKDELDRIIAAPPGVVGDRRQWRFGAVYSLLWPRGSVVRASALRAYNPYHPQPPTDRMLVVGAVSEPTQSVELPDPDWKTALAEVLVRDGAADLRAGVSDARFLREAVVEVQASPVDAGYLLLHPRVIGVQRSAGDLVVRLELQEAYQ
jgi:hypothetical protein